MQRVRLPEHRDSKIPKAELVVFGRELIAIAFNELSMKKREAVVSAHSPQRAKKNKDVKKD